MANNTFANIVLPSVFSDHMVLQQNEIVSLWGWANPSEEITIKPSWTDEVFKTKANNQAKWELKIKTPGYGGPYSILIKGFNEIVLNDILIGEVWLCSGQSNMEMSASWGITNMSEIEKANNSNIRFFNIPKISAETVQNNVMANWEVCSPEVMKKSSAVAYFFAKRLQENLKSVPVGLIVSAWGGTPAETWMSEETVKTDRILDTAANKLTPVQWGPIEPGRAFNAMINPIAGYNLAGVLWYQGEANVGSEVYDKTLEALIISWRHLWKKDFPFYLVQIAPFNYGKDNFDGVAIRNAQRKVADRVENTEMVVISDISTIDDIHPKNKKSVGERLANLALKKHYEVLNSLVESPSFSVVEFRENKAILFFKYGNDLYIKTKNSLFEIAGDDKIYYTAKATIKNNVVTLRTKKVIRPKFVRFAWSNTASSNLFNSVHLPVSSFTTE
jgi:sialate O-acetylesterase